MTFLLDVNLLMALLWENHEHHQTARPWPPLIKTDEVVKAKVEKLFSGPNQS